MVSVDPAGGIQNDERTNQCCRMVVHYLPYIARVPSRSDQVPLSFYTGVWERATMCCSVAPRPRLDAWWGRGSETRSGSAYSSFLREDTESRLSAAKSWTDGRQAERVHRVAEISSLWLDWAGVTGSAERLMSRLLEVT